MLRSTFIAVENCDYSYFLAARLSVEIQKLLLFFKHGRPQTFFQGRAKIFQGGARTYFLPKKQQKRYYFSQKSLKTYYFWPAFASQGRARAPPCPPLRTSMFALNLQEQSVKFGRSIKFFALVESGFGRVFVCIITSSTERQINFENVWKHFMPLSRINRFHDVIQECGNLIAREL